MLRKEEGGRAGCGRSGLEPCVGGGSDTRDGMPSAGSGKTQEGDRLFAQRDRDPTVTSATSREKSDMNEVNGSSSPYPRAGPAPASPFLRLQVPSSLSLPVQHPPTNSSFDKIRTPSQGLPVARGSYNQLREPPKRRGYSRTDSEVGVKLAWPR